MDLKSFSLFPRLPCEIRAMIWFYTITPAIVYTKPVGNKSPERPRKQENPSLLRVCHESRTAGLQRYKLASDINKTYVNFDLDTIYINYDGSSSLINHPLRSSENEAWFQYLAIDMDFFRVLDMEMLVEKVSRCKRLRQLTLVCGFTQAINRECEANVSTIVTKYGAMAKDTAMASIDELIGGRSDDLLTFDEVCEVLSCTWVCLVREQFPDRDKWPEIFVVARPAITENKGALNVGKVDPINRG
jgi:hypothetical protein